MAHKWIRYEHPNPPTELLEGPHRRCERCGVVQQRVSNTAWMRVISYNWWPKVGRCPMDKKKPRRKK